MGVEGRCWGRLGYLNSCNVSGSVGYFSSRGISRKKIIRLWLCAFFRLTGHKFRAEFRPHRCNCPSAFICRLLSVVCFQLFCILIFGEIRKIKYLILARVRYLIGSSLEKILVNTSLEDVVKLRFDFGRLASKRIDGNGVDNMLNLWKLPVLIKDCYFDVSLTVHLSIILVTDQLNAQILVL